jgi:hypothetical protein
LDHARATVGDELPHTDVPDQPHREEASDGALYDHGGHFLPADGGFDRRDGAHRGAPPDLVHHTHEPLDPHRGAVEMQPQAAQERPAHALDRQHGEMHQFPAHDHHASVGEPSEGALHKHRGVDAAHSADGVLHRGEDLCQRGKDDWVGVGG